MAAQPSACCRRWAMAHLRPPAFVGWKRVAGQFNGLLLLSQPVDIGADHIFVPRCMERKCLAMAGLFGWSNPARTSHFDGAQSTAPYLYGREGAPECVVTSKGSNISSFSTSRPHL